MSVVGWKFTTATHLDVVWVRTWWNVAASLLGGALPWVDDVAGGLAAWEEAAVAALARRWLASVVVDPFEQNDGLNVRFVCRNECAGSDVKSTLQMRKLCATTTR